MLDRKNPRTKQQRAVLAAASVFAEKGYHGASTRDIAERMGIQQGSIYYYFKSKEDALADVCLFGIEDYVSHMETTAVSDQPFETKLLATITSHLTSYRERNEALRVHNTERLYLPKEKRTNLKALGSRYRQLLEEMFEKGIADGALRPTVDAHFAAQTVIGLCNAWGDLIVRDSALDVFDAIQKCHDLLLNGLRERRSKNRDLSGD
ncbi:MAG: TetR/AcrR family transcriptional regulator [Woeseiaceae bacterium]|nr:TetR/AcrR family transcriptional regulator [Woeseiaceae bacterium]